MTYGVRGGQQFSLGVSVRKAPPLTVRPVTVDGLVAGQSQVVDIQRYLDSPLASPQCSVSAVRVLTGSGVTGTASGCRVTVTAGAQARRTASLLFVVSDAPGRSVQGQIARDDQGSTGRPGWGARRRRRHRGRAGAGVVVAAPVRRGFPRPAVRVAASGQKTQLCTASPCTVTGLKNGQPVTFTVRARNAVDWSPVSPSSNAVTPDLKPNRVTVGTVTPGDRTLTVTWAPPVPNGGSAVTTLRGPLGRQGRRRRRRRRQVPGRRDVRRPSAASPTTTATASPSGPATVSAGASPAREVVGQSVGTPGTVPAPRVAARDPGPDDDKAQLTVTWDAVDPNGPAITGYTIYRDGTRIATDVARQPHERRPGALRRRDPPLHRDGHQRREQDLGPRGRRVPSSPTASLRRRTVRNVAPRCPNQSAVASWNLGSRTPPAYSAAPVADLGPVRRDDLLRRRLLPSGGATLAGLGVIEQTAQVRVVNHRRTTVRVVRGPAVSTSPTGPTQAVTGVSRPAAATPAALHLHRHVDVPTNGRPETTSTYRAAPRPRDVVPVATPPTRSPKTVTITTHSRAPGRSVSKAATDQPAQPPRSRTRPAGSRTPARSEPRWPVEPCVPQGCDVVQVKSTAATGGPSSCSLHRRPPAGGCLADLHLQVDAPGTNTTAQPVRLAPLRAPRPRARPSPAGNGTGPPVAGSAVTRPEPCLEAPPSTRDLPTPTERSAS